MKCPECETELTERARFCLECGHALRHAAKVPAFDYQQPHSYTPKHHADNFVASRSVIEGGSGSLSQ
jgi:predicted amidophosphoribosyltransferase